MPGRLHVRFAEHKNEYFFPKDYKRKRATSLPPPPPAAHEYLQVPSKHASHASFDGSFRAPAHVPFSHGTHSPASRIGSHLLPSHGTHSPHGSHSSSSPDGAHSSHTLSSSQGTPLSASRTQALPPPSPAQVPSHIPSSAPSYPPTPTRAPRPRRYSDSSRYGPAYAHIHPILARDKQLPPLRFDLRRRPRHITDAHRHHLPSALLAEPATNPPIAALTVASSRLPWAFRIEGATRSERYDAAYVSVRDVLDGLYAAMRAPVGEREYKAYADRRGVRHAFAERCRVSSRPAEEKAQGLRRVDLLTTRIWFAGLERGEGGVWNLRLAESEVTK
ncbi:hypothetical protein K523DRAFT_308126 [Schizophyllum commune Tattone D]|nr:hypothetical protein K523DRAFT_308126 [Schizophyllum commune Tattone D]